MTSEPRIFELPIFYTRAKGGSRSSQM